MLAFWVFAKDFVIFARDKQTFLLLIAMPLLLIAILGFALSGVVKDSTDEATLANFKIAVVDEDLSEQSAMFVDEILIGQLSDMLTVSKLEHVQVAEAFKADQISVALYLPEGFGLAFEQHTAPTVKLVSHGDTSIEQSIIAISLQHYQNVDLAVDYITEKLTATFIAQAQQAEAVFDQSNVDSIFATMSETGNSLEEAKTEQNVRMGSQTVGSFQYYAVGMGVMYLLITVTSLVGSMLSEKEEPVYLRQFVSKLTAQHYLIGKYLSLIVMSFLQLTITVLGTSILFKVDWGNSIVSIIFTMLTLTLSTSALGLFIASFIKKATTFNSMSMVGTQILAALGGSFLPIYLFPEWMVTVTKVLPNALGLQMFLDVMTGATLVDIWQTGVIALVVSLVLFIFAWIRLGRKGGAVYV